MRKKILFLAMVIVGLKSTASVRVDTIYVYSSYHTGDSSKIFLDIIATVSDQPCWIKDTNIVHTGNFIQVDLCYFGGNLTSTCQRRDTIDLGVMHNDVIQILAIFKGDFNNQCISSNFYKDSFDFAINTSNTGIHETSLLDFIWQLSPNPTTNTLTIQTSTTGNLTYQVLATDGRTLIQNKTPNPNFEIDVSTLPAGLYFLQLQNNRNRWIKKFVKQ